MHKVLHAPFSFIFWTDTHLCRFSTYETAITKTRLFYHIALSANIYFANVIGKLSHVLVLCGSKSHFLTVFLVDCSKTPRAHLRVHTYRRTYVFLKIARTLNTYSTIWNIGGRLTYLDNFMFGFLSGLALFKFTFKHCQAHYGNLKARRGNILMPGYVLLRLADT